MSGQTLTAIGWIIGGLFWGVVVIVVALDVVEWFT